MKEHLYDLLDHTVQVEINYGNACAVISGTLYKLGEGGKFIVTVTSTGNTGGQIVFAPDAVIKVSGNFIYI